MKRFVLAIFIMFAPLASGQALNLDSLDKLSAKASETVKITLDGSLLRLASGFLSDGDKDAAELKKLVAGLTSIVVRSFEFKNAGAYLDSDVEALRNQLNHPGWKKIVEVRGKTDGDADIYLHTQADHILGLAVISAAPKELTVIHIDGALDLQGLRKLSGNLGIPASVRKNIDSRTK